MVSIVEDDASIRIATAKLVRLNGFDALAFASAEEFLDSPRLKETECLIADVKMPGMSGLELQRYLIEAGSPIPVIFITAFPEEARRAAVLAASATWVLAKPFDGKELLGFLSLAVSDAAGHRIDDGSA